MFLEPAVERNVAQREERILIDDALVEGGRLDEDHEVVSELVELAEIRCDRGAHLRGEDVRSFPFQLLAELVRRELVRAHVVDHPNGTVFFECACTCGCEVQRDVGRVRPVE